MMIKRLLIAISLLLPSIATAQEQESDNSKKMRLTVYPVGDLAVWKSSGEFDPSVLIRLITIKTCDRDSNFKQINDVEIRSFTPSRIVNATEENQKAIANLAPSLIVKANEENHTAIANLLAELRNPTKDIRLPGMDFPRPETLFEVQLTSDLPVFNKNRKFDTSLIFKLLQTVIEDDETLYKLIDPFQKSPEIFCLAALKKDQEKISNLIGAIRAGAQPQTNPTNE